MSVQKQRYEGLSERAITILRLLADGLSDREIADKLVMTINTIKWYNRQIYSILGVGSRTQAVARAHDLQLLDQTTQATVSALPTSHAHNLAAETTRFIGRERETTDVSRLVQESRLATLTGAPGTGKTRLALHVAHELMPHFRDGVYLVSLAPISDPARVVNAIADALGVTEVFGQPILDTLKHILREKHLLLVVDNFEHVLAAAPSLAVLLAATTHLHILATSREALHIYGEHEYAVPLLELPDPDRADPDALASCESVVLFMERARAMQPDFALSTDNALTIAKICVRLEGLPLAIELAAARIKLLTPTALLARLGSRLELLTRGPRDLPTRQQTLRRTIDWSYDLLDAAEKQLFARLAVFRGGRSLEAMEVVCVPGLSIDPLEGVESLLNKSLLLQLPDVEDGEPRFMMLETLHEYALEQLVASGEIEMLRRRHAAYYVDLAERSEPELRRGGFSYWMTRLGIENDNLRTALQWALEDGETELGLRLFAALRHYWSMSSRALEAEPWIQVAVAKSENTPPAIRARVLVAVGLLYFISSRQLQGRQYLEEAISLTRATDDQHTLAWALVYLGATSIAQPDGYDASLVMLEEGLAIFRQLDDQPGIAQALNVIGELTRTHGKDDLAQVAYEECLRVVRGTGELRREAMLLGNLSFLAMHRHDYDSAEQLLREALDKTLAMKHDKHLLLTTIVTLAGVFGARGDLARAIRLFGAVEMAFEPLGIGLMPGDQPEYERNLTFVRSQLDEESFRTYFDEGRALSFEQMVTYARQA